jgi:hypothetical protein
VEPGVLLDLRSKLATSKFRSLLLFLVGWRKEPEQDEPRLEQALQRLRAIQTCMYWGLSERAAPWQ